MSTQEKPQCMIALESANAVRLKIKQIKISIACGSLDPVTVLSERSERIKVCDLLKSIRGVGPVKVEQILKAAEIPRGLRVDELCGQRHIRIVEEVMVLMEHLAELEEARVA